MTLRAKSRRIPHVLISGHNMEISEDPIYENMIYVSLIGEIYINLSKTTI